MSGNLKMTKEVAIELAGKTEDSLESISLVMDIYNDFDEYVKEADFHLELALAQLSAYNSRTCSSCKYYGYANEESMIEDCNYGGIDHMYNQDSFGCNKWEKKDD